VVFPASVRERYDTLFRFGGSPIGNSRVKLTNVEDCVKRGLVQEGEDPLHVAARQLEKDNIDILHTIGGDDTNTTAADLEAYLKSNGFDLTVVGLPKTIDNDVYPIRQTLGAVTAAEQGARFFRNVANENTTSVRQLIVHEVMGRHCGWLTAATAQKYQDSLADYDFLPDAMLHEMRWGVDAVWVPEMHIDMEAECARLCEKMDQHDSVNIFISEGAGIDNIVAELEEKTGKPVARDAFGHVKLDEIGVGKWFSDHLKAGLHVQKILVQKSGYFARSAAANDEDLQLIRDSAKVAAAAALDGTSGVAGLDEEAGDEMRIIEFPRIKGGKPFDIDEPWFDELLERIGQPKGHRIESL
jgi:pyrophosphate--fructose-6-phosphate 1-phosphotransferase